MFLIFFFESKYPDLLNQSHCMKPISHPLCHLLCTTHNLWGIGCHPNPMWPASCHPILLWPSVLDYPATQERPITFSSVQSLSRVRLFTTPWTSAHQASLSITNSQSLLTLMITESVMPSNHLILCHPLLLPSIFPSFRVFSYESVLHIRWPKYWSFSFSISPSNEYSGLISIMMDCVDLFAVQGTLKSLLQYHSSKASILWHSAFFIVQLSHPYMTTG